MSSHFPSICSRVLPLTNCSILPTSPFSFLKLNYPLASSCAAVLDSVVVFFIERRKGSSGISHHTLPHNPPAEDHSCLQANILSTFHCRFPDSLSCLGSKKQLLLDLGSPYHPHLVTSFCFSKVSMGFFLRNFNFSDVWLPLCHTYVIKPPENPKRLRFGEHLGW